MLYALAIVLASGGVLGPEDIITGANEKTVTPIVEQQASDAHAAEPFRVATEPALTLPVLASVVGVQDVPPAAEQTPPPPEPAAKWENSLTLGFGASTGNTESASFNGLASFKRTSKEDTLLIDGNYFYGTSEGDKNTNKGTAGITYDWNIPDTRFFIFGDTRYEFDEFKTWRHRVSAHAGPGYYLVKSTDLDWSIRGGIGAAKEFASDRNEIYPEALAGTDLEWRINPDHKFFANFRIYPDLEDSGEFRTVSNAGYQIKIPRMEGMSLSLGLLHEHQSKVDDGVKKNDLKLFGGLTWSF